MIKKILNCFLNIIKCIIQTLLNVTSITCKLFIFGAIICYGLKGECFNEHYLVMALVIWCLSTFLSLIIPSRTISYDTAKTSSSIQKLVPQNYESNEGVIRMATHEAGHVIVAKCVGIDVENVEINDGNAFTSTKASIRTAIDLRNYVKMIYAGAAAEEVVFGNYEAGSLIEDKSDFVRATKYLRVIVAMEDKTISKSMLDPDIDAKAMDLSNELYGEAKDFVTKNRDTIVRFAKELATKLSIEKNEIDKIVVQK